VNTPSRPELPRGGSVALGGHRHAASAGSAPALLPLGHYPTPVQRLDALCSPGAELRVQRDDRTNPTYGGNKVRKLEHLLGDALARGRRRIVTVGAIGSHHVLATALFGRRAGLQVEAILVPQPVTPHVDEVRRASLAQGLRAFAVGSWAAALPALAWRVASGAHPLMIGGSSVLGSSGYVAAARELAAQVRRGEMPEPDACVVALGSGGTAGGLAAGFEAEGLRTRVVGVCVSEPPWALRWLACGLARACAARAGVAVSWSRVRTRLRLDTRFLGAGYGFATKDGAAATSAAARVELTLDPTYTAKAFACALWHVRARAAPVILYWHTLSSAPMAPLLEESSPSNPPPGYG